MRELKLAVVSRHRFLLRRTLPRVRELKLPFGEVFAVAVRVAPFPGCVN